jgi:hypothetical protein
MSEFPTPNWYDWCRLDLGSLCSLYLQVELVRQSVDRLKINYDNRLHLPDLLTPLRGVIYFSMYIPVFWYVQPIDSPDFGSLKQNELTNWREAGLIAPFNRAIVKDERRIILNFDWASHRQLSRIQAESPSRVSTYRHFFYCFGNQKN